VEKEYDAVKNCVSTPDDDKSRMLENRAFAAIDLLRYLNDPVSLPFLYRMSRKAEGYYRKVFEDMFYETVEKSPVAVIRATLDTPEKMSHVDANRLCEAIDRRNISYVDEKDAPEDVDDAYAFILEHLCYMTNAHKLLAIDERLVKRYPEYATSVQRAMVWEKVKDYVSPSPLPEAAKWVTDAKSTFAPLTKTPPEQRTDMRQRFKNLPAPAAAEKEE